MKKIWIVPVADALAGGGSYFWELDQQSGLPGGLAQRKRPLGL